MTDTALQAPRFLRAMRGETDAEKAVIAAYLRLPVGIWPEAADAIGAVADGGEASKALTRFTALTGIANGGDLERLGAALGNLEKERMG